MKKPLTKWELLKLWFLTLFYHTSLSYDYAFDTLMEPLFWFVDHFTKVLGRIFVFVVVMLVTKVIIIAHMLGLPFWWNKSPALTIGLVIFGYWIIINLVFNFYQVAVISPGLPVDTELLMGCSVTVCKKCINPKPPRTHHCSICNRCYLNMDHHCPWVNNCVGHFNRRYFFMCMVYIVVGCVFIMLFGVELAFRHVILDEDILPVGKQDLTFLVNSANTNPLPSNKEVNVHVIESGQLNSPLDSSLTLQSHSDESEQDLQEKACLLFGIIITKQSLRIIIYFAGLLCIGASLALGGLSLWHAKLISNGETSIEYHTNKAERKRNKSNFRNPYHLGRRRNWELFLGLEKDQITFWRHIIFPSSHKPVGNGYDWSHLTVHTVQRSHS